MKERKLLIFLIITALAIWAYNAKMVRERLRAGGNDKGEAAEEYAGAGTHLKPFVYDGNIRDPFNPLPGQSKEHATKLVAAKAPENTGPPPVIIDGMLWDDKKPSVILRNTRTGEVMSVEKGTQWDGLQIIDIKKDQVKIRTAGREFILRQADLP